MSRRIAFAALTDQGLARANNEDSFTVLKGSDEFSYLVVIADGMGGHQRGELASSTAVHYCSERLARQIHPSMSIEEVEQVLSDIIAKTNLKVYLQSLENPENNGMGTTLTVGLFLHDQLIIGHVGDARVFLLRGHKLRSITKDHTLVQAMVDKGDITAEQAMVHPKRNVITRALGTPELTVADIYLVKVQKEDKFLFSTDGLHDYVDLNDVKEILRNEKDPEIACARLVDLANSEAGADNVTVICGYVLA